MNYELIRTVILITGWPVLILGSIYTMNKATALNRALEKRAYGQLVLTMFIGWTITMYNLGIVATFYMFTDLVMGVTIVLPIFIVWFITIIVLMRIILRLSGESVTINNFYQAMTETANEREKHVKAIDEKNLILIKTRKELEARMQELQKLNKFMVGRENKMRELKEELDILRIKKYN